MGLSGALGQRRWGLQGEAGLTARQSSLMRAEERVTGATDLGTDLSGGLMAALHPWPERVSVYGGMLGRVGVASLIQGEGLPATEALGGLRVGVGRAWELDLGVGRGVGWGHGSTDLRGLAALSWQPAPRPRPSEGRELLISEVPEGVTAYVERPPPDPDAPEPWELAVSEVEAEEPAWEAGELARVEAETIEIREPIHFAFATARILPKSQPVLDAVADLMNADPYLAHVVVEGHASEEGSYRYNYELSNERARSTWMALIEAGVHPDRLSFRGMGEVDPKATGADESTKADNRRVEFHILLRLPPDGPAPVYEGPVRLPWSGAERQSEGTP